MKWPKAPNRRVVVFFSLVLALACAGWAIHAMSSVSEEGCLEAEAQWVPGTVIDFDYDSGWFSISPDENVRLTHNLGGDPGLYLVVMYGRNSYGIHQVNFGTAEELTLWFGCEWFQLNDTTITVRRARNDACPSLPISKRWDEVRVRILANQ